uniref:Inactive receptor kinase At2g26730 family n=1 Tax=Cajanus cajan TaxID=3821 RepID=A0A151RQY4_CAJCA|nr:putative inactive receptor kinase At2g26730 family [Cajanus cajan]
MHNPCCFFFLLCVVLPTCLRPVSCEEDGWDGVVVTASNLLALQAFKQELVDPEGFLRSWNDSGYGACSGGWVGIKCAQGQVIVIQLPWKGLRGRITDKIGQLQGLRKLSLHDNLIGGSIPSTLGLLPNLRGVQLFNNKLTGSIPSSLGYCPLLQSLDLSNNLLTGTIPYSLANSTKLYWLNLSFNSFSGPLPTSLTHSFSLTFLSLQHNNLSGPLPNSWGGRVLLVVLITLCCIMLFCLIRKRATSKAENGRARAGGTSIEKGVPPVAAGDVEAGGEVGGKLVHFDGPMAFTADDLLCATAEIMGKSTYGTVYKAILEDGSQVAVKRLREKITKGQREFESEVSVLGKIRHPNVLAMRAYYLGPKGEKLLVFDYMPKGSLASFLHGGGTETSIDWPTRMKIAQDLARGLFYLHSQENIVHGNLTSSNVLLDENTNAKIADFGLSRLMTTAANSNVIATAGALGYRAPELSKLKKANTKTDIYSLGVILLELLTRKSPGVSMNGVDLPQWVASIVKEEWTNEVFDADLMRDASTVSDELLNTLKLALHCVDPSPSARPEVHQVLQQLEEIRQERSVTASPGDDPNII